MNKWDVNVVWIFVFDSGGSEGDQNDFPDSASANDQEQHEETKSNNATAKPDNQESTSPASSKSFKEQTKDFATMKVVTGIGSFMSKVVVKSVVSIGSNKDKSPKHDKNNE